MRGKREMETKDENRKKYTRVFGTLFSNRVSMITIHNHWVPLKFLLFGISNLSEI